MRTLHILRGFPASGKTTYAKKWVAQDPSNRIRVNRDTLRLMAHDGVHIRPDGRNTAGTEKAIIASRNALIETWLNMDLDVIVDDTNLADWHVDSLQVIARKTKSWVEIVDMRDVPIEICIERDAQRQERERLGAEVILAMYARYGHNSRGA